MSVFIVRVNADVSDQADIFNRDEHSAPGAGKDAAPPLAILIVAKARLGPDPLAFGGNRFEERDKGVEIALFELPNDYARTAAATGCIIPKTFPSGSCAY